MLVRGGEILNDATEEDAEYVGMSRFRVPKFTGVFVEEWE